MRRLLEDGRIEQGSYAPGSLPPRVRRCLDLLCLGLTYRDIGDEMGLSVYTIKAMLQHAYRSLGVYNRSQAIVVWIARRGFRY